MAEKKSQFLTKYKNRIVSVVICFTIAVICAELLRRHYGRRARGQDDLVGQMENRLLDLRFLFRGERPATGKIGILAIDEKSLQQFGRWPISRRSYGPAFKNLQDLGVNWLGFDVVWSQNELPLLSDVAGNLERLNGLNETNWKTELDRELQDIASTKEASAADQAVAKSITDFGNVVLGFFYYASEEEAGELGDKRFAGLDKMAENSIQALIMPDGKELKDYPKLKTLGMVGNTDYIASRASHFAFFNNESDPDAIMRWVTLVRSVDGFLFPSLSLKTAATATGREIVVFFDNDGITDISLVNPNDDQDLIKIPVDPDGRARILINHLGPSKTIHHFSLADAYNNNFTDEQKKELKGMSLLLGPTAIAINDQRANPFDAGINGVENHAAVIDNILSGSFMKRSEKIHYIELGLIFGIALLFSPLMVFAKAAWSGIGAVLFLVGYYYFDKYVWFGRGEWVYMGMPFIQMTTMFVGTTLYKYMTEEREKKKIKGALGMYLSPDVANEVAADPDALKLGGQRKELTVFFSDVRSFTTISEGLTPEKLGELMNEYFTPMAQIIQKSRGTLDKYIGDAIMAFWGAPLQIDNHAETAARAAIEMMFALDKIRDDFKKKGFPSVDIGIGLNTGLMSVGNFGSPQRFCYTVMGDEVNLGSRLEAATKDYGVKIMISEKTQRLLTAKDLFTRDLDDIRVKGKMQPVKVFELMRHDMLKQERDLRSLIGEFHLGRDAYKQQNWDKAKQHFMACMMIRPEDGPSVMYLDRIADKEAGPLVANWDGVYTRKSK